MSNLERDLRDLLSRRADATATSPGDWQDLTVRMARRNQRSKRVLATALVAALLVGPLAGFAVARAVENTEPGGRVTAAGPGDAGASPNVSTTDRAMLSANAAGVYVYPGAGQNLEKLFRRTTADGIAIRAFISKLGTSNCQGDGWCPPADCFPDGAVTGEMSTEAAVGFASGSHYAGEAPDLRLTGGGAFGASGEGSPARWTVAQAGAQVKKVRVSYEGGGRDEMAPVNGVVLLAAPADATKSGGTVEALDGNGNVLEHADASQAVGVVLGVNTFSSDSSTSIKITAGAVVGQSTPATTIAPSATGAGTVVPPAPSSGSSSSDGQLPSRCTPPPPSLPAPGEQPADAAAARTEIEHAFATAYNGGLGSDDAKRAVVQDSDALKPVMDEIRNGTFAQQVKDATAQVTDVVFTSPTEAAVRYNINVANYSNFNDRIGRALLIDGHWKVARVTVCADISLAGASCPPA